MKHGVTLRLTAAVMQEEQTFNIRKSITSNSNTFLMFIIQIHNMFEWGQKVNMTYGASCSCCHLEKLPQDTSASSDPA